MTSIDKTIQRERRKERWGKTMLIRTARNGIKTKPTKKFNRADRGSSGNYRIAGLKEESELTRIFSGKRQTDERLI